MLLWGAAQPFAGAIADRYGAVPVLSVGAVLYAARPRVDGLCRHAARMLHLTAGVLIGFGLAGSSFTIVIGAFGKLMPPEWRVARLRRRHRGRLVRAVPVLAARRGADRSIRLAGHAADLRRRRASRSCRCRSRSPRRDGAARPRRKPARRGNRWRRRSPKRSATAATCCWCSASSPAASSSSSSPCICRPIWSTAACRPRSAAGRSPSSGCSTSSARSPPAGSPTSCPSATSCRSSISRARSRSSSSSCCRRARSRP